MLTAKERFFFFFLASFSQLFFNNNIFFIFFFFLNVFLFLILKNGVTPLYIAAEKGYEQIVQLLLEKGKPNVDLPNQVILLIVSFSFSFFTFSFFYFF